jgi:hypothetical protein
VHEHKDCPLFFLLFLFQGAVAQTKVLQPLFIGTKGMLGVRGSKLCVLGFANNNATGDLQ